MINENEQNVWTNWIKALVSQLEELKQDIKDSDAKNDAQHDRIFVKIEKIEKELFKSTIDFEKYKASSTVKIAGLIAGALIVLNLAFYIFSHFFMS